MTQMPELPRGMFYRITMLTYRGSGDSLHYSTQEVMVELRQKWRIGFGSTRLSRVRANAHDDADILLSAQALYKDWYEDQERESHIQQLLGDYPPRKELTP